MRALSFPIPSDGRLPCRDGFAKVRAQWRKSDPLMGCAAWQREVPGSLEAIWCARARVSVSRQPKPPVSIVEVELCVRDSYCSIDRARRDLDYRPIINTLEGLRRTAREAREYYDSL